MSGMIGADAMSMDSGPESQFNFNDIDKQTAKAGELGKKNMRFRKASQGPSLPKGPADVKRGIMAISGGIAPPESLMGAIPENALAESF